MLTRFTGRLTHTIYPESDTKFFAKILRDRISFTDAQGQVESLILHTPEQDWPMKRIDAETARLIEDKRAERMKSHSASPDQAALRGFIAGLISGHPNYDEISYALDEATPVIG